jgi:serine kinase of HPr protein (carbohydrate metabolism regulator)
VQTATPTIHASCVLTGAKAVLIRGEPGSGKSRLALLLLQAAGRGDLAFARLVGDDRIHLEARDGRLIARPAQELAGMLEVRGLGIQTLHYEPLAVVGLVVDVGQPAERLPAPDALATSINGIKLPRLAVPGGVEPVPLILKTLEYRSGRI